MLALISETVHNKHKLKLESTCLLSSPNAPLLIRPRLHSIFNNTYPTNNIWITSSNNVRNLR